MTQLRAAFLAEDVAAGDTGLNITSAFTTGRAFLELPMPCKFILVGAYQFGPGENDEDHVFDIEVDTPTGQPAAKLQTRPSTAKRHALIKDSRSTNEVFTAFTFASAALFEAHQFGRHSIPLTLDGTGITLLNYDVLQYPGDGTLPADASSLAP